MRCQRNARVPLKAHQAEGHKALRATERQRPTEEMRDTPLLPRFSHHLPRSPRTPPRAQRRTEAERRPTTRSQSQAASEECSSPLCRGSVDREDDEVTARRPRPNLRRACACVHRRRGGVGSPRALRTESTPSSDCPRFRAVPPVGEIALSRPAAAKAVWPSLSSDRTEARSARQRPRTVHYSRLGVST